MMPERETKTDRVPVDEALSLSGKVLKINSPGLWWRSILFFEVVCKVNAILLSWNGKTYVGRPSDLSKAALTWNSDRTILIIAATHSLVSPDISGMARFWLVTLHISFDSVALTPQAVEFHFGSFKRLTLTTGTRHSRHVGCRRRKFFGLGCVQIWKIETRLAEFHFEAACLFNNVLAM
jgi:hypothetical protein